MRKSIPCNLSNVSRDKPALEGIIQHLLPQLEDELTSTIKWYSPLARLVPGTLEFISLESLHNSRYKMNYRYQWNVFNACLDINATEVANETVNFSLSDNALIFELIESEPGTTADEL